MKFSQVDGQNFMLPEDFRIGTNITIFGRTFRIVDCDAFTRSSLLQSGIAVPDPEVHSDRARDRIQIV